MATGFYGTSNVVEGDIATLVAQAQAAADSAEADAILTAADVVSTSADAATASAAATTASNAASNAEASEDAAAISAAQASNNAVNANNSSIYASEWAIQPEDTPVSVAAGGNGTTDFSALHWAAKAAASGGGGTSWTIVETTAPTLASGDMWLVDSSVARTGTLPATPATDDEVIIKDDAGNAATNNITVARNGSTILGSAADFTIDVNYAMVRLKYNGTTWKVVS